MKLGLITLSAQGAALAGRLAILLGGADVYVHRSVVAAEPGGRAKGFSKIKTLTVRIFEKYNGLVYIAPCGVVVRALEGRLLHKKSDPAVVVMDVGGRYAVSLLSGHEGGANALALRVANVIGAEPVITTTSEAARSVIAGIGCRRGVSEGEVRTAVEAALRKARVAIEEVRLLASADLKADEAGLLAAAQAMGLPLRFISSEEIRSTRRSFARSRFVAGKVGLPAVAEPAALLAGRRTQLILQKTIFGRVTVALAREKFMS